MAHLPCSHTAARRATLPRALSHMPAALLFAGAMPSGDWRAPMVLLSTRLTEVRAFRCGHPPGCWRVPARLRLLGASTLQRLHSTALNSLLLYWLASC